MLDITWKMARFSGLVMGLAALQWSGVPAVFADEVAGRVTASIEPGFAGSIADGEHVRLGEGEAWSIFTWRQPTETAESAVSKRRAV